MKAVLRKLCSPILGLFESGNEAYVYKPSHRKVLVILGMLCLIISLVSLVFTIKTSEPGGVLPILVFFMTGLVCEIVSLLGSERAVARIWSRK